MAVLDSSEDKDSEDKGKMATVASVPMAKDFEGAGSAPRLDGRDCRGCSDLGSKIGYTNFNSAFF